MGRGAKAEDIDRWIGAEIRAKRVAQGLSQSAVGEAIGVTYQQVQKYEVGRDRMTVSRLMQIAAYLDVPLTHFLPEEVAEPSGRDRLERAPVASGPGAKLLHAFEALDRERQRLVLDVAQALAFDSDRTRAQRRAARAIHAIAEPAA